MEYDDKYYDLKWQKVIKSMPKGGDYQFPLRRYGRLSIPP
jgi:hypothetical protein